jgi:hypothetical protein
MVPIICARNTIANSNEIQRERRKSSYSSRFHGTTFEKSEIWILFEFDAHETYFGRGGKKRRKYESVADGFENIEGECWALGRA